MATKKVKKADGDAAPLTPREAVLAKFGAEALVNVTGETRQLEHGVIPTGCLGLDRATGIGGWPRGRIVEVYGPESSGKTTLCLHALAEAQRAGLTCAFIDAEHALDVTYAAALGVDMSAVLLAQPDSAEQGLDLVGCLAQTASVGLIVVDSVAAMTPQAELDADMAKSVVGLHARLMAKAMRKLAGVAAKSGTCVIFINQTRSKIGVTFGSPETTTGGNALKFAASMRVDLRFIGQVKDGEDTIAVNVRARLKKNKLGAPYTSTEYMIRFGQGIDQAEETIKAAEELGLVVKNGAWFSYGDDPALGALAGTRIAQGRIRVAAVWLEHPEQQELLVGLVRVRLAQPAQAATVVT